jgi:hypothetical protein
MCTPHRGASAPLDPRRWKGLALLLHACLIVIVESAIALVALPSIEAEFAFSARDLPAP